MKHPMIVAISTAILALSASSADASRSINPFQLGTFNDLGFNFLPPELLSDSVEVLEDTLVFPGQKHYLHCFMSFHVPTLLPGQTIQSAKLKFHVTAYVSIGPILVPGVGFTSTSHATENFTLFSVSTPAADLVLPYDNPSGVPGDVNPAGQAIFADLGGTSAYASFDVGAGDVGSTVSIPLNSLAVSSLNASSGGNLSVGIAFTGVQFPGYAGFMGAPAVNQGLKFSTTLNTQVLEVTLFPPCPTDVNGDGISNTRDLALLVSHYGQRVPARTLGDINGDGLVNTIDLAALLSQFGKVCS